MTKIAHFFKANSRIGLTNKPVRQSELNVGVEDGADFILTEDFLDQFPNYKLDDFIFSKPEDLNPDSYVATLIAELVSFKNLIKSKLERGEMQVVVGGDNTVTFSSLLALVERVGDVGKIGYIQFDSHGESNSFAGSISKNFHGMYLRPFFDKFDIPEVDLLIPDKLLSNQALFFGDMVLDGDEPEFFKENNLRNVTFKEYQDSQIKIDEELTKFLTRFDYIHVNFDIDVFHRSVAGATGIPEDGKWMLEETLNILKIISTHSNLSFDLSEINPKKQGAEQTIKVARDVLKTIIG